MLETNIPDRQCCVVPKHLQTRRVSAVQLSLYVVSALSLSTDGRDVDKERPITPEELLQLPRCAAIRLFKNSLSRCVFRKAFVAHQGMFKHEVRFSFIRQSSFRSRRGLSII